MSLLKVDNITVRYGRLTALRGASLTVDEGETLFITGPNGAGKSTLLKAIAGVVPVAEGAITLDGKVISGGTPEDTARPVSPWCPRAAMSSAPSPSRRI
jgi:branched-chain amino acid transport system ATP-binding protein